VLKITHAAPSLEPPVIVTQRPVISGSDNLITFNGEILKTGDSEKLKAGFQFREYAGFVEELYSDEWHETETVEISGTSDFSVNPKLKKEGKEYQVRAFVDHPKLRIYGDIVRIRF
jgi:hypothetical protein